jgi:hypothetical protein
VRSYRLTKTAWFGPKRWLGWGWTIASWQGFLTTAVFIALNVAVTFWRPVPGSPVRALIAAHLTLAALFLTMVVLTGDPPGGPRRRIPSGI